MTRRVNFTSAKTVTHRIAMPMLKPKKISMMGIIRLRCHNHFGRQYALQNVEPATQLALYAPGAALSCFIHNSCGLISLVERGFWTYKLNKDGNNYADLLEEKSASLLLRLPELITCSNALRLIVQVPPLIESKGGLQLLDSPG